MLTCSPDMDIMIPYLKAQVQSVTLSGPLFLSSHIDRGFTMLPQHITGIPLSSDFLEKAGFIQDGNFFEKNGLLLLWTGNSVLNYYGHSKSEKSVEIKYLHHLQNLYFDLWGEELDIKL